MKNSINRRTMMQGILLTAAALLTPWKFRNNSTPKPRPTSEDAELPSGFWLGH